MFNIDRSLVLGQYKTSYIQFIINTATELSQIISTVTEDMQVAIKYAENEVLNIKDTKCAVDNILKMFLNLEHRINVTKNNLVISYEKWLNECINAGTSKPTISVKLKSRNKSVNSESIQDKSIVEIENSSSSELEIVNEITYDKEILSPMNDKQINLQLNETLKHENNSSVHETCKEVSEVFENSNLITDEENLDNGSFLMSDDSAASIKSEESLIKKNKNFLLDYQLRSKCTVQIPRLPEEVLNNCLISQTKTSLDPEFLRAIDLSTLEKQKNKRYFQSSNSSLSNNSTTTINCTKVKKKFKKVKISESESDISSFDTSSNESYSKTSYQTSNEDSDQISSQILIQNEERLKEQLLEMDEESSEDTFDIEEDESSSLEFEEKKHINNNINKTSSDSFSSESEITSKPKWSNNKLLNFKLSADDNNQVKHKNKILDNPQTKSNSDTDVSINKVSDDSESEICLALDKKSQESDDCEIINGDSNESEISARINSKSQLVNNNSYQSNKAGRRNIRKLIEDQQIAEDTKQAVKDEESRLQRLAERKLQLGTTLHSNDSATKGSLILDYNLETKEALVKVDRELVKHLKPHQQEGILFMWDSCFETLDLARTTNGSGCILAHCMGLGKTFQIITLVHTILMNKNIGVKTVMVVCPMNTILNWVDEFDLWLKNVENRKLSIYKLTQCKSTSSRISKLKSWHEGGGVLIVSYDMFRSFTSSNKYLNPIQFRKMKYFLMNPGPDLVVCDEGHLLKNEESLLAEKMQSIRTKRRIILTGTPLQNNLSEYHCMVQFVKPNLLGTKDEFRNRFSNPITNGQFDNSTPKDVTLMKHRSHVLHRMLLGCVQRCDYSVLTPFLPPKQEYVILIRLSELQIEMYKYFIKNVININSKHYSLFKNYHEIKLLVAHPKAMKLKSQLKEPFHNLEKFRQDQNLKDSSQVNTSKDVWWSQFIKDIHLEDISISYKLVLLFGILERCEIEQDKLLVFSQCLYTLDMIESFLQQLSSDFGTDANSNLFNFKGKWKRDVDYFRLDGSIKSERRNILCKSFNNPDNKRVRLFLISTKAGGLGINLIGANRVVVFDPSWNPSNDVQSVFRIFRFGQKKTCYIYRFLTAGTMEQKIYNRQVTKLSLALRVVDEQQIERHYRDSDLTELYKFEPYTDDKPILNLPKDHVLADVFLKYKNYVHNFFEHDSLLENKEEEELDEDEQKQAWLDYQQEKFIEKNVDVAIKAKGKINQKRRVIDKSLEILSENSHSGDILSEQSIES